MSASFAKAVMPRPRKRREADTESDWALGWVFPIKVDSASPETDAPVRLKLTPEESPVEERS
jgi:hypothetical protein